MEKMHGYYSPQVRNVFAEFSRLTEEERAQVMCWFCSGCYRYVGPGDTCHCENDE